MECSVQVPATSSAVVEADPQRYGVLPESCEAAGMLSPSSDHSQYASEVEISGEASGSSSNPTGWPTQPKNPAHDLGNGRLDSRARPLPGLRRLSYPFPVRERASPQACRYNHSSVRQAESFMRSFDDTQGSQWQAAVLDASYGSMLLVFSLAGDSVVRKVAMSAENLRLAEQQLVEMDQSQLRRLLEASVPWE